MIVFPVKQKRRVAEHQEMRTDRSVSEISDRDEEASCEERFIYTSIGEACRRAKIDRAPVAMHLKS